MKLVSALRRLVVATTLLAPLALTGCPARAVTPPPAPVVHPPTTDPMMAADGKHFAMTRLYKGQCVGGRGGCYSVTLEPDGSFRNMLLDAAITGSYVIAGDEVQLTPNGGALPSTMTLSADRTRLDDFVYEPAVEP